MEKQIGEVTHFFNKAGVMVVMLKGKISIGDRIRVKRGGKEFDQEVRSMQIEYQDVQSAKGGDEVAIKIEDSAREGDLVYKMEV